MSNSKHYLIPDAQRLRKRGLSYKNIGASLSISGTTVWGWLNPEKSKAINGRKKIRNKTPESIERKRKWSYQYVRRVEVATRMKETTRKCRLNPAQVEKERQAEKEKYHSMKSHPITYFVLDVDRNKVKIGTTTQLKGRIKDLQVGNPNKLLLLGHCTLLEKEIHEAFKNDRCRGEWFEFSPLMREFIGAVTHG